MRSRHQPRLCHNCQAPMAGQEQTCWRCGAEWVSDESPRTPLRVLPAATPSQPPATPATLVAERRTG